MCDRQLRKDFDMISVNFHENFYVISTIRINCDTTLYKIQHFFALKSDKNLDTV